MPLLAAIDINPSWTAGWGTLALVNAGLAQGKHRSGLNWFLRSLLLGSDRDAADRRARRPPETAD